MKRAGVAFRLGAVVARWVQAVNLRYTKDGNPPVYDTTSFPWAADVEREWRAIRAELDRLLTRREELPAFQDIARDVRAISSDRDWKTFILCGYGVKFDRAIEACPETWRILQKIPGLQTAMFSIFEAGKHLPPHRGPYNGVLRFHLGLIVPKATGDTVAIRVRDQICHWHEGAALIFDDAYEHEAWNHSSSLRAVLFVDFVKPLRFPASLLNAIVLRLAIFTPFIREAWTAQKKWEKVFFGKGRVDQD